jgi:hypothetical protein
MVTRKRILAVLTALLVLLPAAPAAAITNGRPDGANHPYVGLMQTFDANNVPLQVCSGSLVSPTGS